MIMTSARAHAGAPLGLPAWADAAAPAAKQHFHGKRMRPGTHRERNAFAASVSANSLGLFSLRLTFACWRKTMLLGLCRRDVVVVGQPDPQTTVPFWVGFSHLFFPALKPISLGQSSDRTVCFQNKSSSTSQLQWQQ